MKLLLTSGGFTNKSISNALFELVGKKPADTTLVYIPTASNVEVGDKEWQINDLKNILKLGFKAIHIVDISAVPQEIWKPQFEKADVMFFEGGDTRHLMDWMVRSGLKDLLPEYLKTKVYVGVSAGSMVAGPELNIEIEHAVYESYMEESKNIPFLGLVDFCIVPHLNSSWYKNLNEDFIRRNIRNAKEKVYCIDDESAVRVVDGKESIVSEGKYFILK